MKKGYHYNSRRADELCAAPHPPSSIAPIPICPSAPTPRPPSSLPCPPLVASQAAANHGHRRHHFVRPLQALGDGARHEQLGQGERAARQAASRKYRAFIAKHFNGDADVCQRLPERRQLQYKPQPCLELAPCRFCQGS